MITEFYLNDKSFEYKQGLTKFGLEELIKDLAENYDFIRQYETEIIFKHNSIYEMLIFQNISVAEFLYNPDFKKDFNRDTIKFLRLIVDASKTTKYKASYVTDVLLHEHTSDTLYGLICLNQIEGTEEKYLIYNKQNWLAFHRYFLGLYPGSENNFIEECRKYFPALFFHERNKKAIKRLLPQFTNTILFHLSMLNDEFYKYKTNPYNRIETLKRFSIACHLHQEASTEGNASRKITLSFEFINNEGQSVRICCEPHLKLCRSDSYPGDCEFYFYRIYFHEGQENIQNGRILIGHIGEHL